MNIEVRALIKTFEKDGDSNLQNSKWGEAKICFAKALELFTRVKQDPNGTPLKQTDLDLEKSIQTKLTEVSAQLARTHRTWGLNALKQKDFARAVEEFEEAINLAAETDLTFLEEAKSLLDRARVKNQDFQIYSEITPYVDRGDDFRKAGNYGEAILEYQEALKGLGNLPLTHRYVEYVHGVMRECRRHLVKPYLTKINRASIAGKYQLAFSLLKRAQLLVDEDDHVYRAFFDQIKDSLSGKLSNKEIEDSEEFESPELWSQAIKDYEEALDLYSSFTMTDPLSPAYGGGNIYEDKFLSARKKLAGLYHSRASRFRDRGQIDKALKNFKEALKLYPRSEKEFHETFREMKKLRAQLSQLNPLSK